MREMWKYSNDEVDNDAHIGRKHLFLNVFVNRNINNRKDNISDVEAENPLCCSTAPDHLIFSYILCFIMC